MRIGIPVCLMLFIGNVLTAQLEAYSTGDWVIGSPKHPSQDVLDAALDIDSIRKRIYTLDTSGATTINEFEKTIDTVPAALWRGGCTPTALSMLFMYYQSLGFPLWDAMGYTIDEFSFLSEMNQELIASTRHMEEFHYPTDPDGYIAPDRSSEPFYTVLNLFRYNRPYWIGGAITYDFPHNDCMADILHTSFSSDDLSQGNTRMLEPLFWLPQWVEQNVAGVSVKSEMWFVNSSYWDRNPDTEKDPWEVIKEEVDAGRPLCGIVNATRWDWTLNHNVIIVGYLEREGQRFYCCRNTWDDTMAWYYYDEPAYGTIFGVAGFFTYEFIRDEITPDLFSTENLYEFYNPTTKSYFFSAYPPEVAFIQNNLNDSWKYQGPAFHVESEQQANNSPVYRFFNKASGGHFYTIDAVERDELLGNSSDVFDYEGIAFYARTEQEEPFFRYHILKSRDPNLQGYEETLYLEDWEERNQYITEQPIEDDGHQWHLAEDGFYYSPSEIIYYPEGRYKAVHRFFLPATNSHYFTVSEGEKDYLLHFSDEDYIKYEGIAWYAEPIIDDGSPFDEYEGDPFID